ncbi:hypothetical protein B0H14DRAFT_3155755 [Mycena olivaceomarginata]|nr:hypothetical protein B0H14DRAFT_3155755 [Mycena olivaceomarginata]
MRAFHLLCVILHVAFSTAASTPTSKEVRDGQTATLIAFPIQPTDTGLKQIPDAAHPFIAPGPNDQRGPGMNTLANHGYIPRKQDPYAHSPADASAIPDSPAVCFRAQYNIQAHWFSKIKPSSLQALKLFPRKSRSCSGIRAVTLQVTSSPHIPPNRKPARLCKPPCMVKGTQCTVNVVLCTRLALMRAVFIKYPDCKFWNKFNRPLAKVRADAGSDPKKLAKYVVSRLLPFQISVVPGDSGTTLKKTRRRVAPRVKLIDRPRDAFQQEVDELITAKTLDTTTTPVEDDD